MIRQARNTVALHPGTPSDEGGIKTDYPDRDQEQGRAKHGRPDLVARLCATQGREELAGAFLPWLPARRAGAVAGHGPDHDAAALGYPLVAGLAVFGG